MRFEFWEAVLTIQLNYTNATTTPKISTFSLNKNVLALLYFENSHLNRGFMLHRKMIYTFQFQEYILNFWLLFFL